ncbi:MAG: hypothetical protein ABI939_07395 [Anaerolineaceae bacterium]
MIGIACVWLIAADGVGGASLSDDRGGYHWPVKILVIGASDSDGSNLPDPAQGWLATLERELPPRIGETVELPYVRFYTYVPGAQAYVDREVSRHKPDVTIVAATAAGFAYPMVGGRLIRLLGWRTGRRFERRIHSWDAAVRHSDGPKRRLHDSAQFIARHTIGASGYSTLEATVDGYGGLIERLARDEQTRVVIMGATHPAGALREQAPKAATAIDQFNILLAAKTRSHHFEWLDRQALTAPLAADEVMQRDGLHKTGAFHRQIADALLGLLSPG